MAGLYSFDAMGPMPSGLPTSVGLAPNLTAGQIDRAGTADRIRQYVYGVKQAHAQRADQSAMELMRADLADSVDRARKFGVDIDALQAKLAAPAPVEPTAVTPDLAEGLAGLLGQLGGDRHRSQDVLHSVMSLAAGRQKTDYENRLQQYGLDREMTLGQLHDAVQSAGALPGLSWGLNSADGGEASPASAPVHRARASKAPMNKARTEALALIRSRPGDTQFAARVRARFRRAYGEKP